MHPSIYHINLFVGCNQNGDVFSPAFFLKRDAAITLSLQSALTHNTLSICSDAGDKLHFLFALKQQREIKDGRGWRECQLQKRKQLITINSNVHGQVEREASMLAASGGISILVVSGVTLYAEEKRS